MTWKKIVAHTFWTAKCNIYFFFIWMYLQAGNIKQILCFYWPLLYDEPTLPAVSCKKTFIFGHTIMNPLLTNLVQSRWQDIVLNGFYFCSWPCKIMSCVLTVSIIVIFARLLQHIVIFVNSVVVICLEHISHYGTEKVKTTFYSINHSESSE